MFKGLILSLLLTLLLTVSPTVTAYDYNYIVKQVNNDLVLLVEGEAFATINDFKLRPKEEQLQILNGALRSADLCVAKGKWGSSVADEAKHKINSAEYHINHLHKMTSDAKVPQHMVTDGERVIRDAYRVGHKNPINFGKRVILECLTHGY